MPAIMVRGRQTTTFYTISASPYTWGVSKIRNNMSFYRRTPVRCERPLGAKNPSAFEPFGSNALETLHSPALRAGASVVQGDIGSIVLEVRHSLNKLIRAKGVSMDIPRVAAIVYAIVMFGVVVFQIALAAGAPWGAYAMGGVAPGQFSPALRIGAIIQAVLLAGMAAVILARAGLILHGWSRVSHWLVWIAVALTAFSLVLNLITP